MESIEFADKLTRGVHRFWDSVRILATMGVVRLFEHTSGVCSNLEVLIGLCTPASFSGVVGVNARDVI